MSTDAIQQFSLFIVDAFTGFSAADVAITQIGHSAHKRERLADGIVQSQHFIGRVIGFGADNMHIQGFQNFTGSVEKGWRIVISANDNDMPAAAVRRITQKVVILLHCTVAGRGGVEYVAGNQQNICLLLTQGIEHPGQKVIKLFVAALPIKAAAQMPV